MRYFTKEMWLGWQEDAPAGDEEALTRRHNRDWRRGVAAYTRQFNRLRGRLDPQTWRFFTNVNMHDGAVVTLQMTERAGAALRRDVRRRGTPAGLEVRLEAVPYVSLGHKAPSYILRYRQVRPARG